MEAKDMAAKTIIDGRSNDNIPHYALAALAIPSPETVTDPKTHPGPHENVNHIAPFQLSRTTPSADGVIASIAATLTVKTTFLDPPAELRQRTLRYT